MRVFFEPAFMRDYKKLVPAMRRQVEDICTVVIPGAASLYALSGMDIKKMAGWQNYYRIRVGDHRLACKWTPAGIIFVRILHRKEVYRYFP